MGSRPVRIGNAAYTPSPARHLRRADGLGLPLRQVRLADLATTLWTNVVRLIDWVCAHWREPDEGIWEVRGGRQEFLYSRVMCWVAIDRAIRLAQQALVPGAARALARGARHDLPRHLRALLGPGARRLRAAPGRHHARRRQRCSCRWCASCRRPTRAGSPPCARIEQELVSDSLVYRYRLGERFSDGLTGQEGTFSMCSFWYVECLSRMGDLHQGAVLLREDARLRESPGTLRRGAGPAGAAPRQLPAGLHAPGADQRRLRSRPAALGRRPRRLNDRSGHTAVPRPFDP